MAREIESWYVLTLPFSMWPLVLDLFARVSMRYPVEHLLFFASISTRHPLRICIPLKRDSGENPGVDLIFWYLSFVPCLRILLVLGFCTLFAIDPFPSSVLDNCILFRDGT